MKPTILALFIAILSACSPPKPAPLRPAFFYWETSLEITPSEQALLDSLGNPKIYVKILDIGKNAQNGGIEPYSRTPILADGPLGKKSFTPCIFITNEVFDGISESKTIWLAEKIQTCWPPDSLDWHELLIDCDWTPSTRAAFFHFLEKLRDYLPPNCTLSATIRLHQYKFPKNTGVPPVDRGMLMFYNTGDVDEEGTHNTVFHPEDASKYVLGAPKNYALPLDLALPLFTWGLVFREGELWKIIPGPLPLNEMRSNGKWREHPATQPFEATLWEVQDGTFLGGHYLRPGDRLRLSATTPELLMEAATWAQKLDLAPDAHLVFFHLGVANSAHFSAQLLDSVCNTVRK